MRKTMLAGVVMAVTAFLVVFVSDVLGLKLESVALLGVAVGATIALVPDGRPEWRLAGFISGFVAAWIGYVLRAAVLPDSTGGRATAYALIILLCVAAVLAGMGRIPLWSPLVGVAALVGAFETAYVAAPSQVVDTSLVSATAVLLATAFGFLAAAAVSPEAGRRRRTAKHNPRNNDQEDSPEPLDNFMVESVR